MTKKHVLIGCKHDMLGNQTFEVLWPLSQLSHQSFKVFEFVDSFLLNKYSRNFKPGISVSKDFRNEVIQIVATQPISETCEAGIFVQTVQMFGYQACDVCAQ